MYKKYVRRPSLCISTTRIHVSTDVFAAAKVTNNKFSERRKRQLFNKSR